MKKVVTADSLMVSFIAAMGYGFGYTVPSAFGLHPAICLALGSVLDMIANKIIFSAYVQKSTKRRYISFACIVLIFLAGYFYLARFFAYSLWTDVGTEMTYSVVLPIVFFFATMGIKIIKKKMLLKKYGTGESGFLFDQEATEALKDFNGENKELLEYTGNNPVVKTYSGTYIGKKTKNFVRFLGIPYATAERWKEPVPLEASKKIYEAYYFGSSAIQPESSHNILSHFRQDEDCLNLNIWTAKLEPMLKSRFSSISTAVTDVTAAAQIPCIILKILQKLFRIRYA